MSSDDSYLDLIEGRRIATELRCHRPSENFSKLRAELREVRSIGPSLADCASEGGLCEQP